MKKFLLDVLRASAGSSSFCKFIHRVLAGGFYRLSRVRIYTRFIFLPALLALFGFAVLDSRAAMANFGEAFRSA